jgi:two-component system, sensor histidine kinase
MNTPGANRPIQVLVADDDPIQRSLVKQRLTRLNATAVEAEDGEEAWMLLLSQTFDLAIVDLSMPNLDGIALTQCIRGHPRTRNVPVIVITSRSDRESIDAAFAAGASSFLVKPVHWSTFGPHVEFLLRLAGAERNARLAIQKSEAAYSAKEMILGGLCIDASARAKSIGEQSESLRMLLAASDRSESLLQRLDKIAEDCRSLNSLTHHASTAIDVLNENVSVGDSKVNLSDIIRHVVEMARPEADMARITLHESVPRAPVVLACDFDSVALALMHLLKNAITYSRTDSIVTVSAKCYPDGMLGIEVADHGRGMHPDDIARILEPLRWPDEGPQKVKGRIGFGIPLAKAVAEAHNGKLEFRSMPGEGLTALFTLPPERVTSLAAAA